MYVLDAAFLGMLLVVTWLLELTDIVLTALALWVDSLGTKAEKRLRTFSKKMAQKYR